MIYPDQISEDFGSLISRMDKKIYICLKNFDEIHFFAPTTNFNYN